MPHLGELLSGMPASAVAILVSIVSSAITSVVMGYTKRPQIVFEQKAVIVSEIARGRVEGVQEIRHALLDAEGLESVLFLETGNPEYLSFRIEPLIIHALLDAKSTSQTMIELNDLLVKYSDMLGYKSRANLMCLCQTLTEIAQLGISKGVDECEYRRICVEGSTALSSLIRKCDGCLVKELNKVRTRFIKRDGLIWNACLRFERRKYSRCMRHFEQLFEDYLAEG